MHLDWSLAAEWGATMSARLVSHGFAPVITIGAKLEQDGTDIRFAVSCAPGLDDTMIRAVFEDLVEQHKQGTHRWTTECPEHGGHEAETLEDLPW